MAVSLSKGQKISLTKAASDAGISGGLTKVCVGLGWDVNQFDGGAKFDLDASAFGLGANGKVLSDDYFVFYGSNKTNAQGMKCDPTGCIVHTGDNRTGLGDGDDETIMIDLQSLPADVDRIAVTVTIYDAEVNRQTFGQVSNSYCRIYDATTGTEIVHYDLGEDFSIETAIVVGELYRHNGEWKFNAVGAGWQGGLAALCNNYGVNLG